ncbi:hypothetical protein BFG07_08420 [Kosakonia cowanii]|uniref:methyl-accepting chemotaxis protein n=1 Tax=Kosakonia cowanii TaxID=208223 RepID=UPI000B96FFA0|nr:methyl-accepting chemotaxis protein [Kosakonia cowanii]AST71552.1 hypothetical protein BFG07_08420 [Kosakonia cowanii]
MKRNTPVTQNEYLINEDSTLLSTTDTQSHITYANTAFIEASGFTEEQLKGQPHNIIRHPDMPPAAFGDMWFTLQQGDSWTGIVKNRRQNGDHYWVRANVTPVYQQGKLTGYISVRNIPAREEIDASASLYQRVNENKIKGYKFYKGLLVRRGLLSFLSLLQRISAAGRIYFGIVPSAALLVVLQFFYFNAVEKSAAVLIIFALLTLFLQQQFSRPLKIVLAQMQRVVSGRKADYQHFNRVDEIGLLMRLVNQSGLNLNSLVGDVSAQIAGIRGVSEQIAREGDALHSRTAETSADLHQTAETAAEAMSRADETSAGAVKSGEAMKQAIAMMQAVSADNSKIVDIIGVIDSIAFQTNILALNAAVEAARAGEAGRGFAVVAAEVRNLAQHSASAARQIQTLIEHNVANVKSGVGMVASTESHLTAMIENVVTMSTMIKEIGTATHEQTQALALINDSVSRVGGMTQNNSGMVDHVTHAAENLSARAARLHRAVHVFGGS